MSKNAAAFRNMTVPKQQGEIARLRVVGGPDMGVVYVLTGAKVTIGRGDENDIVLTDLKASRRHAELAVAPGAALITDMGSSNGIVVNGVSYKRFQLKSGDKIGVGSSVLEFIGSEAGVTQMLMTPPKRVAAAVGTGSSGLTNFIPRPGAAPVYGVQGATAPKGQQTFVERNRKALLMIGGLMAVATLLPQVEQKQKLKKNQYVEPREVEAGRSLSSFVPVAVDESVIKTANVHFKEGFREYRARNFLRAQAAFETALQIYGDHALARNYLDTTKKALDLEAEEHMKTAKKDEEANRLRSALQHYDSVKRLYAKDQSHAKYKEAETRGKEIEVRLKDAERN